MFTRSGAHLVVRSPEITQLVATAGGSSIEIAGRVDEVAVVGGEIWVVDGATPTLRRFDEHGAASGMPRSLWGAPGEGRFLPIAGGSGAALWTAIPAAVIRTDGEPVRVPADAEFVLPVTATRWLACRRGYVALGEPTAERWRAKLMTESHRVVDGVMLFDNRAAALVLDGPTRQLLVIAVHSPVVQHRLTLVDVEAIRFAPARGFALFRSKSQLTLVDLRFGQIVGEHVLEKPLAEFAIDASAQTIALSWADSGELVLVDTAELFRARARTRDDAAEVAPPAPVTTLAIERAPEVVDTEVAAAAPPVAEVAFHRGHAPLASGDALWPRPTPAALDAAASESLLAAHLKLIAALAGNAIACAWDAGRLSFPTDGGMPYKVEVAGLLGRGAKLAGTEVARSQQEIAQAWEGLRAAELAIAPGIAPLDAIADEFGLSTTAQLILIAVAAPRLWGEMARLYGILANDTARALCDELLLAQLYTEEARRTEIARELDRDAPLIRHGILRVAEGQRPFVALSVESIVLQRLRGRNVTEDLEDIRVVAAPCTFDDFLAPASIKSAVAHAMTARSERPPRVVVRGRVGSGRHTLLAILAETAGRTLGVIDATPIVRELRIRIDQLRTALRRAHVLGLLPCIDGLEHIASDDQVSREIVRELLRSHPGPVAVRLPWDAEPPVDPGYLAIDLPTLTGAQRVTAWEVVLARHHLFVRDVPELAARYSVGIGVMMRTAEHVASVETSNGEPRDVAAPLETAIRQHLVTRLRATAGRVSRLATWSQVILPPDVQASVLELISRIKHHGIVYDTWGFDSLASTARGVTALFQGGPGTGKTMVATAIANELGMDLYRVDLSRIMSKWIGETEQNLAKLFDAAEDGHAIILFDEADSLFAKRTEVKTSVDRYANLEVNFLLQRLDTFEGIAILTSNFGTAIDTAFKRRLSFRLTFPFPDEDMRERMWRAHMPAQILRDGKFDTAALARFRLSGGYIRNAVLRAAFLAAEEHVPITQAHLEHAIRAEFGEIGKLSESGILE